MLLVYDIARRPTFESIGKWLQEVRDHADEKIAIILVGNKSDLEDKRQVSKAEAQLFAQKQCKYHRFGFELLLITNEPFCGVEIDFVESSALNSSNVEAAFQNLIAEVYERMQ